MILDLLIQLLIPKTISILTCKTEWFEAPFRGLPSIYGVYPHLAVSSVSQLCFDYYCSASCWTRDPGRVDPAPRWNPGNPLTAV